MLTVNNLTFAYPATNRPIFEGVSLELASGAVCAIIGKNGSGKTTLIKCLAGIHKAGAGQVDIPSPVGYVPQKSNFIYDMKVLDAIVMGRYQYFGSFSMPGKKDYEMARQCADDLNIRHLLDSNFLQLSGGQQQLVMVARALAVGSECIILDEPCSALDYGNQNHILSVIARLKERNMTTIFSTHDPNHVIHVADRVLVMKEHKDYLFGETGQIMTDEVLSGVYGMCLKKLELQEKTIVVPYYD